MRNRRNDPAVPAFLRLTLDDGVVTSVPKNKGVLFVVLFILSQSP
jgi:hypothetical protein